MRKYAMLLGTILLGLASALSYAQAPVPFINLPLVPDATAPGGPEFTLTVNGTGFVSNSVVNWNGAALATQFVSQSQLTATVPAADIATANTGWVTVVSPTPGGGTSNTAFFTVTANTGNFVAFTLASTLIPPWFGLPAGSVAVGDFNGDGKLDLVAGGSIFLGDGTGNFTLASTLPVSGATAVGDFNGDGKLDLAVANASSNTVSIFLGDGTGNFTLASSPAVGDEPWSVAVGDFNQDGILDLAVANIYGGVSILLGDGTGNFTLASSLGIGWWPESVAVGDFNGDGKLDLAVVNGVTTSILLGDGTGNFTEVSSLYTDWGPTSVVVGDFNGDGKLDLAVTNECAYPPCKGCPTPSTVSILLGDGTGNFTLAADLWLNYWLSSIAVGDFNGDGKLDLAVVGSETSILIGDGTGNFAMASSPVKGTGNSSPIALGDFNGDGKLDLAVGGSILLQIPRGAAITPLILDFGDQPVGTTSQPQTLTFTNYSKNALTIFGIGNTGSSPGAFAQTNTCGTSVPAGGSCTISVTFTPTSKGLKTATLEVHDNGGGPQTVAISGSGTQGKGASSQDGCY